MNTKCQYCGSQNIKQIPAGISKKTNKPYNAFYKCEDCGKTFNPPAKTTLAAPNKVEGLLEDIVEQLNAIRVLLEMKRENLDPDSVPF